jgi:NADPH:quinone reductase-like Zn-dependent oxidoreductase
VYYSGTVRLEGAYAEYQRMDAALVGRKPTTLNFVEAAVLPLTTLTAYEALIEKMDIQPGKTVLIINGAGGVGSIAIQLAKWRGLRVAVTASPGAPEQWVCRMGADIVVDYHLDLKDQLKKAGVADVDYILNTYDTNLYFQVCCDLLHPGGKMVSIVRPTAPLDLSPMFSKSLGLYFEYMFTKSLFNMPEKASQGEILDLVAGLLDQGILRTTLNHTLAGLTLENVLTAHQMLLSGKTIGKIGLEM